MLKNLINDIFLYERIIILSDEKSDFKSYVLFDLIMNNLHNNCEITDYFNINNSKLEYYIYKSKFLLRLNSYTYFDNSQIIIKGYDVTFTFTLMKHCDLVLAVMDNNCYLIADKYSKNFNTLIDISSYERTFKIKNIIDKKNEFK